MKAFYKAITYVCFLTLKLIGHNPFNSLKTL